MLSPKLESDFLTTLRSIDLSLKIIAGSKDTLTPTVLISRSEVCELLGVTATTVDKLIHQGIVSGGYSGLVERRHYCKLTPEETNTARFKFNPTTVVRDAWQSFTNYPVTA